MTLPRYQELRDSGIDYLGTVPNAWSLKRLGDIVAFAQGKAHEPYIDDDGDYICVNSRFVSTAGKTFKNCTVNLTPASLKDILMVMSDLPNGRALARAYYVRENGKYAVNQRVCRITAEKAESGFLFYLLDRHPGLMKNDDGVHQTHLSNDDFLKLKIYLPSLSEQTQIARFLDHETSRIDALIEEQQRLIELLKEKRQAVISHAVTKGLDPTAPMKDSGVEWLGEVPKHWIISQLKFNTTEMQTGPFGSQLHAEDYVDGGIPLINPAHMVDGRIIPDLQVSVDEETWSRLSRHALKAGEIIFARRGELGRCAVVSKEQEGWLCGTGSLKASLNSRLSSEYAYLLVTSKGVVSELSLESKGSTMENLNTETLGRVRLPLPPLSEQEAILEHVHEIAGQFAALINEAEDGIKLITERRSALISAAVTGKIDVRGWQPPVSTQAPEPALAEAH